MENLIKYLISLFKKDVDRLITDFTKVGQKLDARAEELITEAVSLQGKARTNLETAARAKRASANISQLVA